MSNKVKLRSSSKNDNLESNYYNFYCVSRVLCYQNRMIVNPEMDFP